MIYVSLPTKDGPVAIRDIAVADIAALVEYWHCGIADLEFLGIDREKLGAPLDTRQRFLGSICTGDRHQATVAFAITLNNALIGYTSLNRHTPDENYLHVHLIDRSVRGKGLITLILPHAFRLFYELFLIQRLVIQTRTRNLAINRVFDKLRLPIIETRYFASPDGVAGPGEFHMRYLLSGDFTDWFQAIATN